GGFGNFLEQTAGRGAAVARDAGQTAQSTAAGAADSAGNFADFASRKRAEWAAQARSAQADAKKTATAVKSSAAAAVKSSAAAAVESAGTAAQSASDDFFEQLATPTTDSGEAAESPDPASTVNPFEELPSFDAEDAASTDALDAGFSGQPGSIPAGFKP
ncbi:MAG: hypothetical protein ACKO2P_06985, partial [Planctomycetota bacterium]